MMNEVDLVRLGRDFSRESKRWESSSFEVRDAPVVCDQRGNLVSHFVRKQKESYIKLLYNFSGPLEEADTIYPALVHFKNIVHLSIIFLCETVDVARLKKAI
jgi:hypothetical protein